MSVDFTFRGDDKGLSKTLSDTRKGFEEIDKRAKQTNRTLTDTDRRLKGLGQAAPVSQFGALTAATSKYGKVVAQVGSPVAAFAGSLGGMGASVAGATLSMASAGPAALALGVVIGGVTLAVNKYRDSMRAAEEATKRLKEQQQQARKAAEERRRAEIAAADAARKAAAELQRGAIQQSRSPFQSRLAQQLGEEEVKRQRELLDFRMRNMLTGQQSAAVEKEIEQTQLRRTELLRRGADDQRLIAELLRKEAKDANEARKIEFERMRILGRQRDRKDELVKLDRSILVLNEKSRDLEKDRLRLDDERARLADKEAAMRNDELRKQDELLAKEREKTAQKKEQLRLDLDRVSALQSQIDAIVAGNNAAAGGAAAGGGAAQEPARQPFRGVQFGGFSQMQQRTNQQFAGVQAGTNQRFGGGGFVPPQGGGRGGGGGGETRVSARDVQKEVADRAAAEISSSFQSAIDDLDRRLKDPTLTRDEKRALGGQRQTLETRQGRESRAAGREAAGRFRRGRRQPGGLTGAEREELGVDQARVDALVNQTAKRQGVDQTTQNQTQQLAQALQNAVGDISSLQAKQQATDKVIQAITGLQNNGRRDRR